MQRDRQIPISTLKPSRTIKYYLEKCTDRKTKREMIETASDQQIVRGNLVYENIFEWTKTKL